jgi:hypothetical protein
MYNHNDVNYHTYHVEDLDVDGRVALANRT